ncbi:MAG: efflux RND transporter periplasmic adaptor subunit [Deltaproteobacteria bacterium]|nr:efflux RND transporter periplasmic adaptor subunit [Deltaproteobacteria bacterium]
MKKPLLLLPVVLVAAGTAVFLFLRSRNAEDGSVLRVSGNIEATEAEVGFKIAGRVLERPVDEGQRVDRGQLLARLDSADLSQQVAAGRAAVAVAQAALAELVAGSRPEEITQASAGAARARAALDELLNGSRPQEIAAADAQVALDRADAARLRLDAERARNLLEAGLATVQQNDAAQTAYEVARNRVKESEERRSLVVAGPRPEQIRQARAALTQAEEQYALVRQGPRRETIAQARAHLEQVTQTLAQTETTLGYATLSSPLSGLVLSKNVEPGEVVAPGTPVVTVADLHVVWLRGYVPESDLGRVKLGQRARVTTDTYPGKAYEGRVSFLSSQAEFTPKAVQTPKERVKLVYRVKIDVPNPALELKPGMPADAAIETGTAP